MPFDEEGGEKRAGERAADSGGGEPAVERDVRGYRPGSAAGVSGYACDGLPFLFATICLRQVAVRPDLMLPDRMFARREVGGANVRG